MSHYFKNVKRITIDQKLVLTDKNAIVKVKSVGNKINKDHYLAIQLHNIAFSYMKIKTKAFINVFKDSLELVLQLNRLSSPVPPYRKENNITFNINSSIILIYL